MDILEELVRKSYKRFKDKEQKNVSGLCPSDENMACLIAGKVHPRQKDRLLYHILSCRKCEENMRNYFQLVAWEFRDVQKRSVVPDDLAAKVKGLMPKSVNRISDEILEVVLEFGKDFIRLAKTTGEILVDKTLRHSVPAAVFRGKGEEVKEKSITISKVADNFIVDIKIEMAKEGLINLTVYLKDKKTQKPSSQERVSLVYGDRELNSSLTGQGKVAFDNIELKDYKINLIRKGESICIAVVFLKALV